MEAVGQLAGGIAHDFNNFLAVVQMVSSTLLDLAELPSPVRDGLHDIAAAADHAARLTRQLLVFSRRQVADSVDLDVAETIRGATSLLRRLLGEQVTLMTELAPNLPLVHGDPGMLEQVLMNLAINARDAMPGGGVLTVTAEGVEGPTPRAFGPPLEVGGARHVRLTVSDTGCGIPAEQLPRIFEPFFTTKGVGEGAGLGLATVFGIVELHGGAIDVQSTVGVGTIFRVFLPGTAPSPALGGPAFTRALGPAGSETILLVEDDDALRAATRVGLTRYGYAVLEAESAEEALRIHRDRGNEVDLLLTDLVMPGDMSGRQLAEKLISEAPSLKVMFTSGYSPEIVNRLLHLAPGQVLLQKPYTASVLASTVRRVSDGAAEARTP